MDTFAFVSPDADPLRASPGPVFRCPRCRGTGPDKLYVYGGAWFRADGDGRALADDIELEAPRPDATALCLKPNDEGEECGHRDALYRFVIGASPHGPPQGAIEASRRNS